MPILSNPKHEAFAIALAKGKKLFDKRDTAAKKDIERKLRQGHFD